jgi:HAD superfamily hydrolase (TIGR01509 family)
VTGNSFGQTEPFQLTPPASPAGPGGADEKRARPGRRPPARVGARRGNGALRAVLFDMDGLLVDSEPFWFEVETAVMARLGGPWGAEDQHALLGGSLERSVSYMLAKAEAARNPSPASPGAANAAAAGGPPSNPAASEQSERRAEVAGWLLGGMLDLIAARGLPLLPGAAELLAAVAAAGIPYALVTSSQREIMDAVLTATGARFPVTVCREDVTHTKPHPEPYLKAAALLGEDPRGCVALEDSPSGVAAAEAAGCAVVAVPTVAMVPGPGRLVVGSLMQISLDTLREAVAASPETSA